MGIINNFLEKIGLKQNRQLLQEENSDRSDSITRADELVAEAKEKFNSSVKVTLVEESKSNQETSNDMQENKRDKKPVLKVFAESGEGTPAEYIVKLETEAGSLIPISIIRERTEEIHLRDIISKISDLVIAIQDASNSEDISKTQNDIKEEMNFLNKKYKISFTRDMNSLVENINLGNGINYQMLIDTLPTSIDISHLTQAQVLQYGKILTERLTLLDGIKTPEDAYKARISLESFMKSQEKKTAQSAIVTANLENLENGEQSLDVPTIVALAKKLETIKNEDGLLYSTYLKLEENRIIRKLQKDILDYKQGIQDVPGNLSIHQISESLIEYLDSTITRTSSDNKDDIIAYMIDTLQGKGIENYAKNCLQYDTRFKVFLKHTPIQNQEEALDYIVARMSCFGQVVDTIDSGSNEEKIKNLRSFIEVTDYKDEDNSESKDFLYTIAQIEMEYIKNNYSPILREFKKVIDTQR